MLDPALIKTIRVIRGQSHSQLFLNSQKPPGIFEPAHPRWPTNPRRGIFLFVPFTRELDDNPVQPGTSIDLHELRDERNAEAHIVVRVLRVVPVTIGGTAVRSGVVPAATTIHAVRALGLSPNSFITPFLKPLLSACSV